MIHPSLIGGATTAVKPFPTSRVARLGRPTDYWGPTTPAFSTRGQRHRGESSMQGANGTQQDCRTDDVFGFVDPSGWGSHTVAIV
jgi:hypothetical protein